MEDNSLAQQYKLDVTVLGDRSREVFHAPTQCHDHGTAVKMWQRQRFLADNVYLEKAPSGELRVIKQMHWKDGKSHMAELQLMGRVTKEKDLFVQFLGWFPSQDHVSFAIEYCPLGDVSQCFQDPVSEIMARDMCGQLLEGLGKLHEMKITHRDIKPQNVLVMQKDPIWVKIGDFGISKLALEDKTELRTRAGTEGYMAPEVLGLLDDEREDSSYSCAVDIWSLGCFVHYSLTKTAPFATYVSLRDFCWGLSTFPESLLVEQGVSWSGREFIKELMALQPYERPLASKGFISNWVITDDSRATTLANDFEETSRESIRLGKLPDGVQVQQFTSEDEPLDLMSQCNCSSLDDEMDYHSSELWLATKDVNADLGRIRSLLDSGADPNKMRGGYTALHHAAERGPVRRMELLIEYGANINSGTRPHQETALHLATYHGDISKLRLLLNDRRTEIDSQNADGDTTLHLAILRFRTTEAMKLLFDNDASSEIKGRNGYTPLQYALSLDLEEKSRFLLENRAKPDAQDYNGRTPLHQAVASDRITLEFIRQLVEAGAIVDQQDKKKRTALYEAVKFNKRDVMYYLIDNGASCEIGNSGLQRRLQRVQFWRTFYSRLPWPLGN